DTDTKKKHKLLSDDYIHFDFETGPILAQGINDSLLQSHEGIIRLFPAVRKDDEVSFTLYAEGGFRVSAELRCGDYVVTAENLRGESLHVGLPEWLNAETALFYRSSGGDFERFMPSSKQTAAGTEFGIEDGAAGEIILISSADISALEARPLAASEPNSDMKECGGVSLGSPALMQTTE
ncbi:MAG: hypothetical protein K6D94_10570, partial [Clostridiales bacterium]|nr:hypothetical protein [Clostridiales bacterium]